MNNNRCTLTFQHVEFTRFSVRYGRNREHIVWAVNGAGAYRYAREHLRIEPLRITDAPHPLESWMLKHGANN